MNNQDKVETGVSPYQPSARESIHKHDFCIFADLENNMGRYGLNGRCEESCHKAGNSPQQDLGIDEVDNVISKLAYQSSPVTMKQAQKGNMMRARRNSLSISDQQFSDDSDSESEDLAHFSLQSDVYKAINTSAIESTIERHAEQHNQIMKNKHKNKSYLPLLLPIVGVLSVVLGVYFDEILNLTQELKCNQNYDESKFTEDMIALGEKYQIKDPIFEVQIGISTILKRNDTGSFVFLYDSGTVNFNGQQFRNFMNDIASTTARYLRNESASIQPTIIQSSELNMQTHSELMSKYKHDVAKTGVMLIQDVDRVPSSLAMAFHYFCDEYNPLVTKSAIFFTLNLAKCPNGSDLKTTHHEVEKCLENKWSLVPKDNIKPLLARVVNVVIDVTGVS